MVQTGESVPVAGTSRRYPIWGGKFGVVRYVGDGGSIVLNPTEENEFSILWSSRLGPDEALERLAPLITLAPSYVWIGGVGMGEDFVCPSPQEAPEFIKSHPQVVQAYSFGDEAGGVFWYHPRENAVQGGEYSGVGLEVREMGRDTIQAAISATAIEAVQADAENALDAFAQDVPQLRWA
jgi:hypothetical protein